jgi:hypothetical protein
MPLIDYSSASLVRPGDTAANPGGPGLTTSATTNANALAAAGQDDLPPGPVVGGNMQGTAAAHPIPWWIALIVVLIVWHLVDSRGGNESKSVSELKIGVGNAFKTSLMVGVVFTLAKWVFTYYTIPGVSPLVENL